MGYFLLYLLYVLPVFGVTLLSAQVLCLRNKVNNNYRDYADVIHSMNIIRDRVARAYERINSIHIFLDIHEQFVDSHIKLVKNLNKKENND